MKGLTATLVRSLVLTATVQCVIASPVTAQFSLVSSDCTIAFSVRELQMPVPFPTPDISMTTGELISPGPGYPSINPIPLGMAQVENGPLTFDRTADPDLIDAGLFGTGRSRLISQEGLVGAGGPRGVYCPIFFITEGPASDPLTASVNVTRATATFRRSAPDTEIIPATALSLTGRVGGDGDFVAASLTGNIIFSGGALPFTPIVVAFDGPGGNIDFVSPASAGIMTNAGDEMSFNVDVATRLRPVPILRNERLTVNATLTLIGSAGDPDSITNPAQQSNLSSPFRNLQFRNPPQRTFLVSKPHVGLGIRNPARTFGFFAVGNRTIRNGLRVRP